MMESSHAPKPTSYNRDALGRRLQREFIAYHQRRRRLRTAIPAAAVMGILMCCCWGWWSRHSANVDKQPIAHRDAENATRSPSPRTKERFEEAADPVPASTPTFPRAKPSTAQLAHYRSIDVQLISDEELEQSLRELPSDWMVVSIDGEMRAFQESELKPAPRHQPGG